MLYGVRDGGPDIEVRKRRVMHPDIGCRETASVSQNHRMGVNIDGSGASRGIAKRGDVPIVGYKLRALLDDSIEPCAYKESKDRAQYVSDDFPVDSHMPPLQCAMTY